MKRSALLVVSIFAVGAASLSAQQRTPSTAPQGLPATRAAAATGAVTRVRMTGTGTTQKFEPAVLNVKVGDVVEFVNVSGFPHNVAFEPAKIPAGASPVLMAAMANRMGNSLMGPMMTQANQTYRVSFAGAPVGAYEVFCMPHKAMGMKMTINVAASASRR
jgi:plastocyanin